MSFSENVFISEPSVYVHHLLLGGNQLSGDLLESAKLSRWIECDINFPIWRDNSATGDFFVGLVNKIEFVHLHNRIGNNGKLETFSRSFPRILEDDRNQEWLSYFWNAPYITDANPSSLIQMEVIEKSFGTPRESVEQLFVVR